MGKRALQVRDRRRRETTVVETDFHRALRENPEVQIVLDIVAQATRAHVPEIPIDFDSIPTTTVATAD
jgi:hypothetical protein